MTVYAGTVIGRYEIRSPLGAGGMGEVYLAQDTALERTVALKILPAEIASDSQRMQRFIQEARTASSLNHPNILTIHEIGQSDAVHFIATEFIDGITLRQHMTKGRMKLDEALEVAVQIATALSAAHAAGVVHRDIKPENIMVRNDGYIKVLDFGLAKPTEHQSGSVDTEAATKMLVNTSPGMVMGTVSFMSPEQTRGFQLDARTDIWSLGVVLYEMVTGHMPFTGETASDVIVSVLDREPLPLPLYLPKAPVELHRIVRKALRKDRDERYQTIKDLLIDLRALKQEMEFEAKLERSAAPESGSEAVYKTSDWRTSQIALETDKEEAGRTGVISAAHPTTSAEYLISEIKRHKTGAILALLVISMLALTGIAFAVYKFTQHEGQTAVVTPFQSIKIGRLTSTGNSIDAAISPDGKYVAHVVSDGAQRSLWIRQVATSSNAQLVPPLESNYHGLTFSPDGNYVYYVRGERNKPLGELYQVSVLGGDARKLLTDIDTAVTFSPDGKRIAFMRSIPGEKEDALLLANADGTGERRLTSRKSPDFFWAPAWSPDGKWIACVAGSSARGSQVTVIAVSVEDGTEKPLTSQKWRGIEKLVWLPNGSGLVMAAIADEASDSSQIWYLSYPGGEVRRITNDLNSYLTVSLTGDSGALATVQSHRFANVWVAPNANANQARQITSGSSFYYNLSWMPDGRIVYSSNVNGNMDIWVMNADGSNQKQLTVNAGSNMFASVSPDGRYIVFVSDRAGGNHNIWRIDADGSNPRQLTDSSNDLFPHCSPDGRWVVYVSAASGKPTIWKAPIDGGTPVQLTDKYSHMPVVSPDGKLIACHYWNEQPDSQFHTAVIPFTGGEPVKTFDLPAKNVRWSRDGRALTYIDTRNAVSNIWSQPLAGGKPVQLTDWKSDRIFNFAWSPDGKRLASSRGIVTNDVVLISDFK